MAVIQSEPIKDRSKTLRICGHVLPYPGIIFRCRSVTELDAIVPHDNLAVEVGFGWVFCEINERFSSPNPAVIGHSKRISWVFGCGGINGEPSEVKLDKGIP